MNLHGNYSLKKIYEPHIFRSQTQIQNQSISKKYCSERSQIRKKTIQKINLNIKKSKELLKILKEKKCIKIQSKYVLEKLDLYSWSLPFCDELEVDKLRSAIETRVDCLKNDLRNASPATGNRQIHKELKNEKCCSVFLLEKEILRKKENSEDLFEFLSVDKQVFKESNHETFWFTDQRKVDSFTKKVGRFGLDFAKISETLKNQTGLDLEDCACSGSTDIAALSKIGRDLPNLFCVRLFYKKQAKCKIQVNSLKLKRAIISELADLSKMVSGERDSQNPLEKESQINEHQTRQKLPFDSKLAKIEGEHGAFVDLGGTVMGGVYLAVCHAQNVKVSELQNVERAIKMKLNNKQYSCFLDPEELGETREKSQQERLFRRIRIKCAKIGESGAKCPFSSFQNSSNLSEPFWTPLQAYQVDLVYLADLITLECNLRRFHSKGLSTARILRLRRQMFASLSRRLPKLQIKEHSFQSQFLVFSKPELNQIRENFDAKLNQIDSKSTKNAGQFVRSFRSLIDSLGSEEAGNSQLTWSLVKEHASPELVANIQSLLQGHLRRKPKDQSLFHSFFQVFSLSTRRLSQKYNQTEGSYFDLLKSAKHFYRAVGQKNNPNHTRNSITSDQKDKIEFGDLNEKYSRLLSRSKGAEGGGAEGVLAQVNGLLRLLAESHAPDDPENLTHLFCLLKYFTLCEDLASVTVDFDLCRFSKFIRFYTANRNTILRVFKEMHSNQVIEKKLLKLLKNARFTSLKTRSFLTFVRVNCKVNFSEHVLSNFIFNGKLTRKRSIVNRSTLPLLKDVLHRIEKINKNTQNPTPTQFWEETREKSKAGLKDARRLCGGLEVLTHADLISVDTDTIKKDSLTPDKVCKYVLQQLLSGDSLESVEHDIANFGTSLVEYCAAMFLIGDYSFRKKMVSLMTQANLAVPFGFSDSASHFVFLHPVSGLSFKFKTRLGQVQRLNPFLHPCTKFAILETDQVSAGIAEQLANALFHDGNPVHQPAKICDPHLKNTSFVSFSTNYDWNGKLEVGELSTVTVNKNCFYFNGSMLPGANFSTQISDVIILLRSCFESSQIWSVYSLIKELNLTSGSRRKLLIEVVESSDPVDLLTRENWHKRVCFDQNVHNLHLQIADLFNFYNEFGNARSDLSALVDVASQTFDFSAEVDILNNELGPIVAGVRQLIPKIEKNDYDFQLQNKMHRIYTHTHAQMVSTVVLNCIDQKNRFFQNILRRIRVRQLRYLHSTLSTSPIFDFIKLLNDFDASQRVQFLWLLDECLSQLSLCRTLDGQETVLRTVNLLRETQQVFEVLTTVVHSASPKQIGNADYLRLIPRLFASLFTNMYPLELLDGNHSSISLRWLTAVMEEVELLSGSISFDPRLTVISIVGQHSTGKSTLLQNLFGVNFTRSDDKSTDGSVAVMLPVKASLQEKHNKPEFLIVIKSGSLKLSSDEQNLKMLLFNLGISNVTIVNSMRQFSNEMLRMVSLLMGSLLQLDAFKVNPIINFVFQGVDSDQSISNQLRLTSVDSIRSQFKKRAQISGSSKNFDEIMRFASEKELFLIPHFGRHDRVSSEYQTRMREFKRALLSDQKLFIERSLTTFKSFCKKIESLNRLLTYRNYLFDSDSLLHAEKTVNVIEFEIRLKVAIKGMLQDLLRTRGLSGIAQLLDHEGGPDQVFRLIQKSDVRRAEFRDRLLRALVDELRDYEVHVDSSDKPRLISEVLSFDLETLREVLFDDLELDQHDRQRFLGDGRDLDQLQKKVTDLLETESTDLLDRFYPKAIRKGFISRQAGLEEFFEKVQPLVSEVIVQMSQPSRDEMKLVEFVSMESVLREIGRKYQNELLHKVDHIFNDKNIQGGHDYLDEYKPQVDQMSGDMVEYATRLVNRVDSAIDSLFYENSFLQSLINKLEDAKVLEKNILEELKKILQMILKKNSKSKSQKFEIYFNFQIQHFRNLRAKQFEENPLLLLDQEDGLISASQIFSEMTATNPVGLRVALNTVPLKRLIDKVLAKISETGANQPKSRFGIDYLNFLILYYVYRFKFNFKRAKSHFMEELRRTVQKPNPHVLTSPKFDGLSWAQIDRRLYFFSHLHLKQAAFEQAQTHLNQQPIESIRYMITRHMKNSITLIDCIRNLKRQLLLESQQSVSEAQIRMFVQKIVYVGANIDHAMRQHALQMLAQEVDKQVLKSEIKALIVKKCHVVVEKLVNLIFSLNPRNLGEINRLGDFLCGQTRAPDFYGPESIDKGRREDTRRADQTRFKQALKKLAQSELLETDNPDHAEKVDELAEDVFKCIHLDIHDMPDYHDIYSHMFDFCEHRCPGCKGTCILKRGHSAAHKYYHLPQIFFGRFESNCSDSFE